MNKRIWVLMLSLSFVLLGTPAFAGFSDPLDTSAVPSALAEHGLFNGLALAGNRIVAVGQRGHILWSDDQGKHWQQATVPVSSDLTAVSFPTANDGWAVGQDGVVLVSHNAGQSWTRQLDGRAIGPLLVRWYQEHAPTGWSEDALARLRADAQRFASEGPDKPLLDVWFSDAQHGYVVGAFNLILSTSDGGKSWVPLLDRTDNPKQFHLYAIRVVGADLYVVGEQGLMMKLDHADDRFHSIDVPYKGTLFGLIGQNTEVIAFGLRGNAVRSDDAGLHWTAVNTGAPVSLTAATFSADHQLLLLSQAGQVLASNDGGQHFAPVTLDQRVPGSAMVVFPDGTIVIAGPNGVHRVSLEKSLGAKP